MRFKNYEIRPVKNSKDYEVVCWNPAYDSCYTICYLRWHDDFYDLQSVCMRIVDHMHILHWLKYFVDYRESTNLLEEVDN